MGKKYNIDAELKKIDESIKVIEQEFPNYSEDKLIDLKQNYDNLLSELILSSDTPLVVKNYIVGETSADTSLPKKYLPLEKFLNLQKKISLTFDDKIKELQELSFGEKAHSLVLHSFFDSSNTKKITIFEDIALKYKKYDEFIKIYRDFFVDTSDTSWLERMGDLYYCAKNYSEAVEVYLNIAEINGPSLPLFKKLAKTFKKLGDSESYKFCLEQIKSIKVMNAN